MKTLAGTWEGVITTTPADPQVQGKPVKVILRVTSSGNVVMHEINIPGREDDPITMFYLDGDRLTAAVAGDGTWLEPVFTGDHGGSYRMGLCTVTSLVPSGKVASIWTSWIISGTPSITSSRLRRVVP